SRLVEQRAAKHDEIARSLGQLRQEERTVEKLPRKRRRRVAHQIERSDRKKRIVVHSCGILSPAGLLQTSAEAHGRCQEQNGGQNIPRAGQKTLRVRNRRRWS